MGVEIVEGVKIVERLERFVLREIIIKSNGRCCCSIGTHHIGRCGE